MYFKLFGELISKPETFILLAFLFLIIVIILFKLDGLEKKIQTIEKSIEDFEKRLQKYELEENEKEQRESDIIDNFLRNNDINLTNKQTKGRIHPDEVLRSEKVSSMIDPREDKK